MPEAEEEEQETENLFEHIMKDNFPNLAKEIDIQVQKAQRIPKIKVHKSLWDNFKCFNICIRSTRRRRERAINWKSI